MTKIKNPTAPASKIARNREHRARSIKERSQLEKVQQDQAEAGLEDQEAEA